MKILTASLCKQGGREYNQDFVAGTVEGCTACLVVCDGLGSYVGSEVASRLCATKIVDDFTAAYNENPERAVLPVSVQSYIFDAHNYVVSQKERTPEIKSSCTTVACMITDGITTVMSHIGDTRIYMFRNNKLVYQSKDHSLSQLAVDMGQIQLRDIRTHKDQNKLTRVLGNDYFIEPDCEIDRSPLIAGDAFIMCSDGFWEYVYEEEMEQDLATSATAEEALGKMEQRLLARIGKYNDNFSAIVAKVVADEVDENGTSENQ